MIKIKKEFSPFFQLQFDGSKKAVGAEILMRPKSGDVKEVINYLAKINLIHELDLLAFKYALKWSVENKINCSSNFSGITIKNKNVVDQICGLDPKALTKIELTESEMIDQIAVDNLHRLSRFGFKLSLDDYGSSNNSLNRVVSLPLTEIKLDRYLIDRLPEPKAVIAIGYTIRMARKMNIEVIAEGIETEHQFEILSELGCDRFQGYLFHKPQVF